MFYALIVNPVYGVIIVFITYGTFGDLLGATPGSLVGAYFLLQVSSHFSGKSAHAAVPKAS